MPFREELRLAKFRDRIIFGRYHICARYYDFFQRTFAWKSIYAILLNELLTDQATAG